MEQPGRLLVDSHRHLEREEAAGGQALSAQDCPGEMWSRRPTGHRRIPGHLLNEPTEKEPRVGQRRDV